MSSQLIDTCVISDHNHLELIPVTSQFPHSYLVNDAGYIADSNGISNIDADYNPK